MLRDIPQDPTRKEYQQGLTLGAEHRHWRRAKFFQQYRLFFRFHSRSKLIVLGWVNDTGTKRAYGSRGHPPMTGKSSWQRQSKRLLACSNSPIDCREELAAASLHCSMMAQVGLCESRWPGGSYSAKS